MFLFCCCLLTAAPRLQRRLVLVVLVLLPFFSWSSSWAPSVSSAVAAPASRFVPSSETLFLIGGIAPQVMATPKGTVSFQTPNGRTHNFAPATVHVLKLSVVRALQSSKLDLKHGGRGGGIGGGLEQDDNVEEDDNNNAPAPAAAAAARLAGVWTQVTPTGTGPGEITGHTAVVDPANDRYIYVSLVRRAPVRERVCMRACCVRVCVC